MPHGVWIYDHPRVRWVRANVTPRPNGISDKPIRRPKYWTRPWGVKTGPFQYVYPEAPEKCNRCRMPAFTIACHGDLATICVHCGIVHENGGPRCPCQDAAQIVCDRPEHSGWCYYERGDNVTAWVFLYACGKCGSTRKA